MPLPAFEAAASGMPSYFDSSVASDRVRVYTEPLQIDGTRFGFVQVARSYHEDDTTLASLRLAMLAVGLVSLLGTGSLSWATAGRALDPVSTLTHAAEDIARSRGFSRRCLLYTSPSPRD